MRLSENPSISFINAGSMNIILNTFFHCEFIYQIVSLEFRLEFILQRKLTANFKLKKKLFPGLASTYPEPEDKRKWLEGQLYNFNYESSMPHTWAWPQPTPMKTRAVKPTKLTEKEETV